MTIEEQAFRARRASLRAWALALAVLGSLLLTGLAFWQARRMQLNAFRFQFERDADTRTELIIQRMNEDVIALKLVGRFLDASATTGRAQFTNFVTSLLAERSELQGVGWVPRVAGAERLAWETEGAQEGLSAFQITERAPDGRMMPAGEHPQGYYYPVLFLEPTNGNELALGFDLGSDPIRRAALERARDTGQPAVTERLQLVQEKEGQTGFVVLVPVYQKGKAVATIAERRTALQGFVMGAFRAVDVLRAALTTTSPIGVTIDLLDLSAPPERSTIHHWILRMPGEETWKTRLVRQPPQFLDKFKCADRAWGIRMTANHAYVNREYPVGHFLVLPIGLLLSMLGGLYVRAILTQREETENTVRVRTAELAAANQKLEAEITQRNEAEIELKKHREHLEMLVAERAAELGRTNEALRQEIVEHHQAQEALAQEEFFMRTLMEHVPVHIYFKDTQSRFLRVNQSMARLFGLSDPAKAVGKDDSAFFTSEHAQAALRDEQEIIRTGRPVVDLEEKETWPDRPPTWVSTTKMPLRDSTGRIMGTFGISRDITDRKRMVQALQESRDYLDQIINCIGDPIFVKNRQHQYVLVNNAQCLFAGKTRAELLGKTDADFFPREQVEVFWAKDDLVMETGQESVNEEVITDPQGEIRTIITKKTLFQDAEGEKHIVGVTRDITERKRMEERIAKLNQLKQHLLGSGALDQKLKLITDGAAGIFGADFARIWMTKEGDLCEHGCIHAAAKEGPGVCRNRARCLHLVASSGRYTHLDGDHRRVPLGCYKIGRVASGEEPYFITNDVVNDPRVHNHEWARSLGLVSFAGYRLVSPEGQPMGVLAFFRQRAIAPREQNLLEDLANTASQVLLEGAAREALLTSEERFRKIFEDGPLGMATVEPGFHFTRANRAFCSMMGYSEQELTALTFKDITHPEHLGADVESVQKLVRGEMADYRTDKRYLRKDGGMLWASVTISAIRDPKGNFLYLLAMLNDITERKQAEDHLKAALAELERSNKELEMFAYVASHDLQEPLRLVSAYTQLLMQRYRAKLDAGADPIVGFITEGVSRMQRLIQDLLAYSRVNTRPKAFGRADCEKVLVQTLTNLSVTIREQQAVVTHDPLPAIKGDEVQLGQLFQNLIGNAIKFRRQEPPSVHLSARKTDDGAAWLFSVRDNGIGIEAEFYERIFIIFQRLHNRTKYSGTGIGLAICKRIVERHGGRIWVESKKDQGSAFSFTIPIDLTTL